MSDDNKNQTPNGVIWGAKNIGKEISKNERQTFYLLETGRLPAQRVGRQWVASRAALRAFFNGE